MNRIMLWSVIGCLALLSAVGTASAVLFGGRRLACPNGNCSTLPQPAAMIRVNDAPPQVPAVNPDTTLEAVVPQPPTALQSTTLEIVRPMQPTETPARTERSVAVPRAKPNKTAQPVRRRGLFGRR
jgi:hypothetical protein